MNELLKIILSLSLSGTILILLLFLLRLLYQNRLSKRWQYYIWLLVIVRLLLPLTPQTSVVGNLFVQMERQIGQYSTASPVTVTEENESPGLLRSERESANSSTEANHVSATDSVGFSQKEQTSSDEQETAGTPSRAGTSEALRIPENILFTLATIWLVIALLLFVRKITIYQSFVKYVNAGSIPVEEMNLLERFGQILAENHVRGAIDLRVNSLVASPLLVGFLHARIILPTVNISSDDFYYTILHELTHYRRKDMFYKWLVQLTVCLHWFNPFVYLMRWETNRLCELSCDERVIATLSENSRKSYGDTLLHAISTGGSYKDALSSVTLNESKELLKGRLDAIMKYQKIPKLVQTVGIFIAGMLIGGAVVLGAYAAPKSDSAGSPDNASTHITSPDAASTDITSMDSASSTANESPDDASAFSGDETFEGKVDFSGTEHSTTIHTYLPNYTIQYEDGIYYIMLEGTTENDKPVSSVTPGYKQLVLVREDYYASFGTFDDHDMTSLAKHITEQCNTMLDNDEITQENANIVIMAAEEIEASYHAKEAEGVVFYNYRQSVYYQRPYMIYMGYNLTPEAQSSYSSTLITLSDRSTIPVWFSEESEKFISDEDVLSAVTALVERVKSEKAGSSPAFEAPIITLVEYIGDSDVNTLAQKYYKEDNLAYFMAVFPELVDRTKQEYLDRMFADDNISFFAACIGMPEDTELQKELVERYILKAYEEDNISFFAVLSGMLEESSLETWKEKCKKDGRDNFCYVLADDEYPVYEDTTDNWADMADEYTNVKSQKQKEITNLMELNRLTKKEVSDNLRTLLDSCDDRTWYLIDGGDGQQYIYYNGLPHTYAYEPNIIQNIGADDRVIIDIVSLGFSNTLRDRDIEENLGNYVLLAFSYAPAKADSDYSLEITYDGLPVTYEIVPSR